jgi:hypothetical protein
VVLLLLLLFPEVLVLLLLPELLLLLLLSLEATEVLLLVI